MFYFLKVLILFLISFQLGFAQSIEVIRQKNAFELVSQKLITKLVTDSAHALQKFVNESPKEPKVKDPLSMAAYEKRLLAGDSAKEVMISKKNDLELEIKIRKNIFTVNYKNVSKGILWVNGKEFSLIKAKTPEYIEFFVNANFPEKKFSLLEIVLPSAHAGFGMAILVVMILTSAVSILSKKIINQFEFEAIIKKVIAQCQYDKSHVISLNKKGIEQNQTVKFLSYMSKVTNKTSTRNIENCADLESSFWHRLNGGAFTSHCKLLSKLDNCLNEVSNVQAVQEFSNSDERNLAPKDIGGAYEQLIDKGSFASER